jgi:hypothetical protein
LAVLLLGLLCWSAWISVKPAPELAGPVKPADTPSTTGKQQAQLRPEAVQEAARTTAVANAPEQPARTAEDMDRAKSAGGSENVASTETSKAAASKTEYPPGIIGMTEKTEGVLLRYSPDQRGWEQLVEPTPLKREDRLLGLDPFRSTLACGSTKVDLVGETELVLGSPLPDKAVRFQLGQGRVAVHGANPTVPFEVQFASKNILISPASGGPVGVERINRFEPGTPESSGSLLRIHGSEGEVALQVDDAKETLVGPSSIVWDGSRWTDKSDRPPPAWVTETKPTAYELQIGERFLEYIRPNRPVITNIVEALDDDQKDVRRLALRALRAVGDLSYITPVLNKADDPVARRETIRVLRAALAQGPDAVKGVHDQLVRDYGEDQAKTLEKFLVGFTAKEARDDPTYTKLVQNLAASDVGIRELALDNLRTLTGRDDLQYDPDKPEGRGLNAWRELLKNHELRAASPAVKSEK